MLSSEELQDIEAGLPHYPDRRALCIDALKIVQQRRGWVSDESITDLAAFLRMSPADVDSVATFYNRIYRRPVGRHVISLCDSVSCWMLGYEQLRDHARHRLGIELGQTSADKKYTLLPIPCLGMCEQAPAVLVNYDRHACVDADRFDQLLEHYNALPD